MNEASLTKNLVRDLGVVMPGSVTIKTNDSVTLGIPDIVHTWAQTVTWMEVKYKAPTCEVYPTQREMMRRLGNAGLAFWVEFHNYGDKKYTMIWEHYYDSMLWSNVKLDTKGVAQFVRERMLHVR